MTLSKGLSKYGPWGYLILGMLLCGGALLVCVLWGKRFFIYSRPYRCHKMIAHYKYHLFFVMWVNTHSKEKSSILLESITINSPNVGIFCSTEGSPTIHFILTILHAQRNFNLRNTHQSCANLRKNFKRIVEK